MNTTPEEIARTLARELASPSAAILYADRVGRSDGPLSADYRAAAAILRARNTPMNDHVVTSLRTEARRFQVYEDALSAAAGLGIMAAPERDGAEWVVRIGAHYYRSATP